MPKSHPKSDSSELYEPWGGFAPSAKNAVQVDAINSAANVVLREFGW